jgi:ketopantoate reductase
LRPPSTKRQWPREKFRPDARFSVLKIKLALKSISEPNDQLCRFIPSVRRRFPIGEPSGEITWDVERLSALFTEAEMQAPVLDRIRDEIRLKLWGNVCLNPINALTHATLDVICSDPATRALSKAIMLESQAIAEKFGVKFRVDVERRIEGAQGRRLQDLERGRPARENGWPLQPGSSGRGKDAGVRMITLS